MAAPSISIVLFCDVTTMGFPLITIAWVKAYLLKDKSKYFSEFRIA